MHRLLLVTLAPQLDIHLNSWLPGNGLNNVFTFLLTYCQTTQ